jgi:hypothetical protein
VTELAKFGFASPNHSSSGVPADSSSPASTLGPDCLRFGSFLVPLLVDLDFPKIFIGNKCADLLCEKLPSSELEHLEVLRLAGYSCEEIMEIMQLPFIPPKDLVFKYLGRCSRCGLRDHLRAACPGVGM